MREGSYYVLIVISVQILLTEWVYQSFIRHKRMTLCCSGVGPVNKIKGPSFNLNADYLTNVTGHFLRSAPWGLVQHESFINEAHRLPAKAHQPAPKWIKVIWLQHTICILHPRAHADALKPPTLVVISVLERNNTESFLNTSSDDGPSALWFYEPHSLIK